MSESFTTLGALRSYTRAGRALILDYGGPRVTITVLTDRIIRVRLAPDGTFAARHSWAVAQADAEFSEVSFAIEESSQSPLHAFLGGITARGPRSATVALSLPR